MTPAKQILRAKIRARALFAAANKWAGADEVQHPYWLGNVRTYQRLACVAMDEHYRLIRSYLNSRGARAK